MVPVFDVYHLYLSSCTVCIICIHVFFLHTHLIINSGQYFCRCRIKCFFSIELVSVCCLRTPLGHVKMSPCPAHRLSVERTNSPHVTHLGDKTSVKQPGQQPRRSWINGVLMSLQIHQTDATFFWQHLDLKLLYFVSWMTSVDSL